MTDALPYVIHTDLAAHIRQHLPPLRRITMDQASLDFSAAREARDAGMAQALAAAERRDDAWPDMAYAFLRRFARTHAYFCGWECTTLADAMGYGAPSDSRAWGAIYNRAQRNGLIVQDGAGRHPGRHASICPRYRSLIYTRSDA